MNRSGAIQQYRQVSTHAGVTDADPHRLVQMLLEGALEKVCTARGHMVRGEVAAKGAQIGWAISILEGLRASLDRERGGEIAANLNDLYDYMERRLLEANLHNDPAILDEVANLLREIKGAWDAIPEAVRAGVPAAAGA
ncbi:flagellar export chaperone FliS [Inmirania thermothiophila]|uniref:Flagellar secretion chaperone FliS n=1 Tax=Inmirania thermothiophila TaxID=1750597 RepID=A0A3N1YB95_9GAMM|nr:flagellar export chaperone FliS [Inmirania thermothiophila]ROR34922.1 flagellar protein FliS [Inmirania thermothiophila]